MLKIILVVTYSFYPGTGPTTLEKTKEFRPAYISESHNGGYKTIEACEEGYKRLLPEIERDVLIASQTGGTLRHTYKCHVRFADD